MTKLEARTFSLEADQPEENIGGWKQGALGRHFFEIAQEQGLFPQIIEAGFLTEKQVKRITDYYQDGNGKKLPLPILDGLSLGIARFANLDENPQQGSDLKSEV